MAGNEPKKTGRGSNLQNGPGKGRPKGVPNKVTATVKEAIERSFQQVGGAEWLVTLAENNPTAYAALLGKLIPKDIKVDGGLDIRHLFTADQLRRMADLQEEGK